jgi:hypothetical protein
VVVVEVALGDLALVVVVVEVAGGGSVGGVDEHGGESMP